LFSLESVRLVFLGLVESFVWNKDEGFCSHEKLCGQVEMFSIVRVVKAALMFFFFILSLSVNWTNWRKIPLSPMQSCVPSDFFLQFSVC